MNVAEIFHGESDRCTVLCCSGEGDIHAPHEIGPSKAVVGRFEFSLALHLGNFGLLFDFGDEAFEEEARLGVVLG